MVKRAQPTPIDTDTGEAITLADEGKPVSARARKAAAAAKAPAKRTEPKARKVPAEVTPKLKAEKPADGEKATRRHFGRGWLAVQIDGILREFAAGTLKDTSGEPVEGPLTVSKVRFLCANSAGEQPSTGAVSAVFDRWAREGYITVTTKPVAFKSFAGKNKTGTLETFLAGRKDARRAARAAAKA